ncbi:hypothetical protein SAMN06265222_10954 [Neorhodopirellula lusitana]|uniref:Uncharacterized protein n=1 Tax=Neorhodopirellula lusitana TaxID=445327 RepID=A0ABY1QCM0_9BACT|nr:hypothetical protein [Neorhodopirellula lusitana]SMP65471.1 hypothetical protein SAMN06265222_10954 [Neorhodopirellula lusitana]
MSSAIAITLRWMARFIAFPPTPFRSSDASDPSDVVLLLQSIAHLETTEARSLRTATKIACNELEAHPLQASAIAPSTQPKEAG